MSEILDRIQSLINASINERARFIEQHKEALCEAWIAQHGFSPAETQLIQQTLEDGSVRVWIEKRGEYPELLDLREEVRQLREKARRLQDENYSLRQDLEEANWRYDSLCK